MVLIDFPVFSVHTLLIELCYDHQARILTIAQYQSINLLSNHLSIIYIYIYIYRYIYIISLLPVLACCAEHERLEPMKQAMQPPGVAAP